MKGKNILEKNLPITSNDKKNSMMFMDEKIKEKEKRLTKATEGSCHQHGQQCNYQHQCNLYEYFPLKFSHV